ncbi:MAG: hypothetical protein JWM73_505 [Solirubrobacterales bacterium]|nr:hypothetical protein [Solirubrobacterales bacterium]
MKAAVLLLALVAALAAAAPAPAASIGDALSVAGARFPTACSPVAVHAGGANSAPVGSDYDWTLVLAASWQGPAVPACEIWLRSDWATWPWPVLCTEVAHEVGHLSGLAHSPDPSNLMYASPDPLAQLGLCGLDDPLPRARAARRGDRRRPTPWQRRRPGGPSSAR